MKRPIIFAAPIVLTLALGGCDEPLDAGDATLHSESDAELEIVDDGREAAHRRATRSRGPECLPSEDHEDEPDPTARARGLTDPRWRVEEDQAAAGEALQAAVTEAELAAARAFAPSPTLAAAEAASDPPPP